MALKNLIIALVGSLLLYSCSTLGNNPCSRDCDRHYQKCMAGCSSLLRHQPPMPLNRNEGYHQYNQGYTACAERCQDYQDNCRKRCSDPVNLNQSRQEK